MDWVKLHTSYDADNSTGKQNCSEVKPREHRRFRGRDVIRRWAGPRPTDPLPPQPVVPRPGPPAAARRAAMRLADATPTVMFAAWLRSCEPAWTAARYGDRDPQVLTQAAAYQRFWCLNTTPPEEPTP